MATSTTTIVFPDSKEDSLVGTKEQSLGRGSSTAIEDDNSIPLSNLHYHNSFLPPRPMSPTLETGLQQISRNEASNPENPSPSPLFKGTCHEIAFIFIIIAAQLMTQTQLGNTIIQTRTLAKTFGVSDEGEAQSSWFVASYSCTVGAFVSITGRLGDLYGHKTLYIIGWFHLALFSLIIPFVADANHSPIPYDILRALTGIGPSMLMPNAAALLASAFPPGFKKNLVFAIFGAIAPAGFILGLAWGGLFDQVADDWRWTYWSTAVVSGLLGLGSLVAVPGELNAVVKGTFDFWGAITSVTGLVLVYFSINGAPGFGWSTPYIPILLVIGLLSLVLFVYIESHTEQPILPIKMLAQPAIAALLLSLSLGWMSFGMFQYYEVQFLLNFRHITPLSVALELLPVALMGFVAAGLAIILLPRTPSYFLFGSSMLFFLLGQILLALQSPHQSYWTLTFPCALLITLGPDISFASASLIISDLSEGKDQGAAGSLVNTVVNYSIALGLALAGNLESSTNDGGREVLRGYRNAWWLGAGFAGTGLAITVVFHRSMSKSHKRD